MLKLRKSHPGKTAKRMVIGSTRKTTGTIIAISFLPPFSIRSRRLSSRTSVDEPRQGGQAGAVGQALQRRREVGAGAGVAETAAEFVGEGAIGEMAYAFERADCALAGAHGQRK